MSNRSNITNGYQCKLQRMENDLLNIDNPNIFFMIIKLIVVVQLISYLLLLESLSFEQFRLWDC